MPQGYEEGGFQDQVNHRLRQELAKEIGFKTLMGLEAQVVVGLQAEELESLRLRLTAAEGQLKTLMDEKAAEAAAAKTPPDAASGE